MATKVVMEALSPTMEEGRLVKWSKNEGDPVKSGDVLAEVETDKAVMELVARGDGVLRKRIANEGDSSPVGTLLAVIAAPDENIDSMVASASAPAKAQPAEQPAVTAADAATPQGSPVPSSPKESQGEASTPPQEKAAAPGATAPSTGAAPRQPAAAAPPRQPAAPRPPAPGGNGAGSAAGGRPRSSPLARRLATDRGIALGSITGSGPGGRIVKR